MGMLDVFRRSAATPPTIGVEPGAPKRQARGFPLVRMMARLFSAAGFDRTTESWGATPLPADDIIRKEQRVLVARSREQAANNDYVAAFLRMVGQNVVGPNGIVMQGQVAKPDGSLDAAVNEALELAWWEWGMPRTCDVAGRKSWRAIQRLCVTTAAKDGEFMVRLVFGADAGAWGLALQVLDPQRCPVDYDVDRVPARPGNFIRHGIEFNRYGRAVAFHFITTDEAEADYRVGGRQFVVIPAEQIIHGFKEDMVGQKRGLPWTSTPLARLKHINGFEQAAVMSARAGAAKMGFFTWKDGFGPDPDEDQGPISVDAEPLSFHELPQGVDFKEYNPQYPNGEFAGFTKRQLQGASAGFGVTYPTLAADLEGVSFSSIRQGELDVRERWKDDQEWLIETLVRPVFEAWLPRALLAGKIMVKGRPLSANRVDELRAVEWQPRRWAWVDPRADVQSAVDSIHNLITSPSAVMRELGRDPQTVYREIAADIESMRAAGIPDDFILAAMGQVATPQPRNNNAPADPAGP